MKVTPLEQSDAGTGTATSLLYLWSDLPGNDSKKTEHKDFFLKLCFITQTAQN
jgi:hypothetical protein